MEEEEKKKVSVVEEKDREVTKEEKELLYSRVEELKRSNAILLEDNAILDKFIACWIPDHILQKGTSGSEAAGGGTFWGRGFGWKRKPRLQTPDHVQLLTMEQKIHMAKKVRAQTQNELNQLHERSLKIMEDYGIALEEAELRRAEIKRSQVDFERKLQKITNDIKLILHQPDKVVQSVEDRFKVFLIKKLILQNQRLDAHKNKLLKRVKEFDEKVEFRFMELYYEYEPPKMFYTVEELKSTNMKIKHNIVSHREQLHNTTMKSAELIKEISKMKQMLNKIEVEIQHTEEECVKAETLNRHLRRQLADYQAPDIAEYMQAKAKHKNVLRSIQSWERKVGIAEMSLKTHTTVWNKQGAALTPANSAENGQRTRRQQVPVKLPDIVEHSI